MKEDRNSSYAWLGISLLAGAALSIGLLALGSFREHPTPSGSLLFWVGPAGVGGLLGYLRPTRPWRWAAAAAFCIPLADGAQIMRDGAADPTSHNLWPIEILFVTAIAAGLALAGAYAGAAIHKWLGSARSS